jgi:hypothetical protein
LLCGAFFRLPGPFLGGAFFFLAGALLCCGAFAFLLCGALSLLPGLFLLGAFLLGALLGGAFLGGAFLGGAFPFLAGAFFFLAGGSLLCRSVLAPGDALLPGRVPLLVRQIWLNRAVGRFWTGNVP